ncbi:MAG: DUF3995 domain-containing protein [Pseudomonadota bacterium]
MKVLSAALAVLLAVIAALHAYWGLGGLWPGATERELIDTVIGDPTFAAMPPLWMCFAVTGALLISAGIAVVSGRARGGLLRWGLIVLTLGIAAVFALRGGAGIAVALGIVEMSPPLSEPFATLDAYFYSPLCLLLGAGFSALCLHQLVGERS